MSKVYENGPYIFAIVVIAGLAYYYILKPGYKYVLVPIYNNYYPPKEQQKIENKTDPLNEMTKKW